MPGEIIFMNQYCPHIKTCLFYQNWEEETKNRVIDFNERKNVIVLKRKVENLYYDCRPLMALNASETNLEQKFNCSHLTLLNQLRDLILTRLDKE